MPNESAEMSDADKLNATYTSVRRIETAIMGDREMGIVGLAEHVTAHGKAIEKLEKDRFANRLMSISGMGAAAHHVVNLFVGK